MEKFEYKTFTLIIPFESGFDSIEPVFNEMGKEGWELVSFSFTNPTQSIFKRKIQQ